MILAHLYLCGSVRCPCSLAAGLEAPGPALCSDCRPATAPHLQPWGVLQGSPAKPARTCNWGRGPAASGAPAESTGLSELSASAGSATSNPVSSCQTYRAPGVASNLLRLHVCRRSPCQTNTGRAGSACALTCSQRRRLSTQQAGSSCCSLTVLGEDLVAQAASGVSHTLYRLSLALRHTQQRRLTFCGSRKPQPGPVPVHACQATAWTRSTAA